MTGREFFTAIVECDIDNELREYAQTALNKLDERNSKRRTSKSATQIENENIKVKILELLTNVGQKSASEVATALELSSTSKASALLRQLVEVGKVKAVEVKVKGKGKHKEYYLD